MIEVVVAEVANQKLWQIWCTGLFTVPRCGQPK
jgi:hypothetical protein